MKILTTGEAAERLGVSAAMVSRMCAASRGFGFKLRHEWRVPELHIERVLRGDTAKQIAAERREEAARLIAAQEEAALAALKAAGGVHDEMRAA